MCFDYDDVVECGQEACRKARKDHRCDCCHAVTIHRGDEYEYRSGIFGGRPYSEKVCRRCLYDISRIVDAELAEDCSWHTSWPAVDDVRDYLINSDMGVTEVGDVPASFDYWEWYKRASDAYTLRMQLKYPRAAAVTT